MLPFQVGTYSEVLTSSGRLVKAGKQPVYQTTFIQQRRSVVIGRGTSLRCRGSTAIRCRGTVLLNGPELECIELAILGINREYHS